MKVLVFILFIFLFNLSYEETVNGIEYSYNKDTMCVEVTLPKPCKYFYIWIDQKENALRVHKDNEEDNVWNEIRVRRNDSTTTKYHYEIGIGTENSTKLYFNFSKELKNNGIDYSGLSESDILGYYGFKNMKCNDSDYFTYVENRDTETKYRPGYHHTPFIGWMNDPNGLVYENMTGTGYYHLFYQFNPYCSQWDNMHWGHSKSKDLLNWIHLPPAIYRFQKGHIFSGSVVFDKYGTANNATGNIPRLVAFFTTFKKYQETDNDNAVHDIQHNYAAVSTDTDGNYYHVYDYETYDIGKFGRQFRKRINPILVPEEEIEFYEENPTGTFNDYVKSSKFNSNYRDPKIVLYKDDLNTTEFYILLISADYEYRIYQNKYFSNSTEKLNDFVTWSLVGRFGKEHGVDVNYIQYECPDIARIFPSGSSHAKWVFIANINPGGPFGGSATEYFTGEFDGATYSSDHYYPKWMDFGKDHYATVTYTNIPNEERVVALPWSSNWIYSGLTPTFQFRSTNGIARELSLFKSSGDYFLNVAPARELPTIRKNSERIEVTVSKKRKKVKMEPLSITDGMLELNIDVTVTGNAKKYGFTLYNNVGEKIDFFFDTKKDKIWNEYGISNSGSFIMDRRYSGDQDFKSVGGWGFSGREKRLPNGVHAYTKKCYKYVDPFRLGTKIPMALLKNQKKHNVQIFYDKSHIEVFLDGGRGAMTNIVFPNGEYYNQLKFYTDKGTVKFDGYAYHLGL